MISESSFLLHGATIITGEGTGTGSVGICGERISGVWYPDDEGMVRFNDREIAFDALPDEFRKTYPESETEDIRGKILMAGGIDAHVHFREPGLTAKADIHTESLAAVCGGVTSFIDMPNTTPPTISEDRLREKLSLAEGRAYANFGFHIGATNSNLPEIKKMTVSCPEDFGGIKVFMGSSTGNMLVDDDAALAGIFRGKTKCILVHCEDEHIIRENLKDAQERFGSLIPFSEHENIRSRKACIRSSARALELAMEYGCRLHLLHISTAEEIEMVRAAKQINKNITAETSINYLWFCDNSYASMGSKVKCNPSIKTAEDRAALREALKNGLIDTIGTDHAPHLENEKERPYLTAPSGIPSIQQSLPVLLTVASQEDIPLGKIASVFSEKPAEMFGISGRGFIKEGYFADIVIADPDKEFTVGKDNLKYKCGWSPYEGVRLKGAITEVFVNGRKTVGNGEVLTTTPFGEKLIFKH